MNRRRIALVAAATLLVSTFSSVGGVTPAAQANYCPPGKIPPEPPSVPPKQPAGVTFFIVGGYNHVGGTQLDSLGCFHGEMLYDTRILPPRAEFVLVVASMACTPGATFGGGQIKGLGVNTNNATLHCGKPNVWGHTAAVTGLYYIRENLAGSVTATFTINGRTYSTTSRTALPVSQPA